MADKQATLDLGGQTQEFPVLEGSVGPDVVDIRKLYGTTGKFTYDPGYKSTASCESALTYIDGEAGVLLHRGYPIGQLAENSSFMEVSYLLLNGELPTQEDLDDFTYTITRHTMVHDQLRQFYQGFRRDAHPMAIMCGVVGALSAFYHDSAAALVSDGRIVAAAQFQGRDALAAALGGPVLISARALAHAVIGNGQDEFLGGAEFGNAFSAQGSLVDGFFAIIVRDFLFLARRSAAHRGGMLQIAARFFRRNVHMTQDAHGDHFISFTQTDAPDTGRIAPRKDTHIRNGKADTLAKRCGQQDIVLLGTDLH